MLGILDIFKKKELTKKVPSNKEVDEAFSDINATLKPGEICQVKETISFEGGGTTCEVCGKSLFFSKKTNIVFCNTGKHARYANGIVKIKPPP